MSGIASSQSHIGPWPIKRAHSVPEPSGTLFTPRNSPPSLAHFLASINENYGNDHDDLVPGQAALKPDWSTYSLDQPLSNWEDGDGVDKRLARAEYELMKMAKVLVGSLIAFGILTFIFVPIYLGNYLARSEPVRIILPYEAPPTKAIYFLMCLYTTMVGVMTMIAAATFGGGIGRRSLKGRDMLMMLPQALALGLVFTTWWSVFVRSTVVIE